MNRTPCLDIHTESTGKNMEEKVVPSLAEEVKLEVEEIPISRLWLSGYRVIGYPKKIRTNLMGRFEVLVSVSDSWLSIASETEPVCLPSLKSPESLKYPESLPSLPSLAIWAEHLDGSTDIYAAAVRYDENQGLITLQSWVESVRLMAVIALPSLDQPPSSLPWITTSDDTVSCP
ncbi:hypothetical protein [Marinicrinis sediminis]|uniref:Uncharacterized protein n=1 Tax=Marinicrinis sediminis TaxID=1652465 RepID=A0ABW5RD12_9BACL